MRTHTLITLIVSALALTACEPQKSSSYTLADRYEAPRGKDKRFSINREYSAAEIERLNERLTPIAARVQQASLDLCTDMGSARDCSVNIVLDPNERGINAHIERHTIVVNPAMVEFAKSDTHLAFVLSHESAHQILGHVTRDRRQARSLLIGIGSAIASNPNASQYGSTIESEADYVGLYILAQAGYPVEKAGSFWPMLSRVQPHAPLAQTHPANYNRSAAMARTAGEIRAKERKHQPLVPEVTAKRG